MASGAACGLIGDHIGARTQNQLKDNVVACQVRLSEEDLKSLSEVSALPREYPGWMIELQSGYRVKMDEP